MERKRKENERNYCIPRLGGRLGAVAGNVTLAVALVAHLAVTGRRALLGDVAVVAAVVALALLLAVARDVAKVAARVALGVVRARAESGLLRRGVVGALARDVARAAALVAIKRGRGTLSGGLDVRAVARLHGRVRLASKIEEDTYKVARHVALVAALLGLGVLAVAADVAVLVAVVANGLVLLALTGNVAS